MVAVCSVVINLKLNARAFGCVHARLLTQYVQCIEHLVCNPLKDMTNIFASHANCTVIRLIWLYLEENLFQEIMCSRNSYNVQTKTQRNHVFS